jgi:hypothetical protein
MPTRAEN